MAYPIILNGDHAEFEAEHANTPPHERLDWPLPSFDAMDWAKAFCKTFIVSRIVGYATKPEDDQEGLMVAWFANALMRGYDEANAQRHRAQDAEGEVLVLRSALTEWHGARSAFLALPQIGTDPKDRVPPDVWNRLATAEQRLYEVSKE